MKISTSVCYAAVVTDQHDCKCGSRLVMVESGYEFVIVPSNTVSARNCESIIPPLAGLWFLTKDDLSCIVHMSRRRLALNVNKNVTIRFCSGGTTISNMTTLNNLYDT